MQWTSNLNQLYLTTGYHYYYYLCMCYVTLPLLIIIIISNNNKLTGFIRVQQWFFSTWWCYTRFWQLLWGVEFFKDSCQFFIHNIQRSNATKKLRCLKRLNLDKLLAKLFACYYQKSESFPYSLTEKK